MIQEADHILIPLLNGGYAKAQAARADSTAALVFITDQTATPTTPTKPLLPSDVLAALLVDIAALPDAHWPVTGYDAVPRGITHPAWPPSDSDHTIHDPAVIEAFANALHGLYPWDGFPDPAFFDAFLIKGEAARPATIRFTKDLPKAEAP